MEILNQANVRNVIHYGSPKSPEGYYQEIGRAGRDGLPSTAFTFWSKKDHNTNQYFLRQRDSIFSRFFFHRSFSEQKRDPSL